uniref:Thiosulfate/3-mercaptopyruvate sulfurtransferase n=1 Tax=Halichondria panicea TaxID=6063 RepID=A0A6C0SMR9_HALPA|nr:thiosulfate/3-mercaptopyruvate sulfurtransferase [Halichondria panicea]
MCSPLVSCEWLKEQLENKNPNIRILDGTWNQPAWKRNAQQEYLDGHIEGAVRFDIATVCDKDSPLPLTLPTAAQFTEHVQKMGISNDTHVVVYDNHAKFGFYSAGRVWWIFKTYGHVNVSILDGGIPKWKSNGYPTVSGPEPQYTPTTYKSIFHPELVRDYEAMMKSRESNTEQVVDGRPKGRYDGTAPEPNPRINSGHMIGSTNLPFMELTNKETMTLKSPADIRKVFESYKIDMDKPMVLTCGGAVVAPLVSFAASLVTGNIVPVYDGSWGDWVRKAPAETMKLGIKGEDMPK